MSAQPMLSIALAAERCAVCRDTIRRAIKTGALKASRVGRGRGVWWIDPIALQAWLNQSVPVVPAPESTAAIDVPAAVVEHFA